MKKIETLAVLFLALVLLCSLTACGKRLDGDITGTWTCSLNMSDVLVQTDSHYQFHQHANRDFSEELLGDLSFNLVLELRADNSYSVYVDEASVRAAAEATLSRFREVLPGLIVEKLGGSEEALIQNYGSLDAMTEFFLGTADPDALTRKLTDLTQDGTHSDGTYSINGSWLQFDMRPSFYNSSPAPGRYNAELNDDELTLSESSSSQWPAFGYADMLLPLVFHR